MLGERRRSDHPELHRSHRRQARGGHLTYGVEYWRDRIANALDFGDPSRDVDRLQAWITEESGGNPASVGTVYEVGIFQIDMQDGPRFGGSVQSLHDDFAAVAIAGLSSWASSSQRSQAQVVARTLSDAQEALQVSTGLAMVKHYRDVSLQQLQAHGLTWSDDDTWCLIKLQHGLPGIPAELLGPAVTSGGTEIGWSEFRAYCEGLSNADRPSNLRGYNFTQIFDNAEKVGYLGGFDGSGFASTAGVVLLLFALWIFAR
jgi:hypothetical protein